MSDRFSWLERYMDRGIKICTAKAYDIRSISHRLEKAVQQGQNILTGHVKITGAAIQQKQGEKIC